MDPWEAVVVEWVNCLKLTDGTISSILELSDGKFFCKVLHLLLGRVVSIDNPVEIFAEINHAIEGKYKPDDWINFSVASGGDKKEILKIASVLIVTCFLQNREQLFQNNPAKVVELESKNSDIIAKLDIINNELKSEKEKSALLKERVQDLEERREELSQENQLKSGILKDTEKQFIELKSQLSRTECENDKLIAEIESLKPKNYSVLESSSALEKQLEKMTCENEKLKTEMRRSKKEHDAIFIDLMHEKTTLEEKVEYLESLKESDNERLPASKRDLHKAEEDFTKSMEALSIDIEKKQAKVVELELKNSDIIAKLDINLNELTSEKEKSALLKERVQDLEKGQEELSQQNQLKSEMLEDTEKQLMELKSQLSKAEEDFTKSLEALSIDIEKEQAKVVELESKNRDNIAWLGIHVKELTSEEEKSALLKERVQDLEKRLEELSQPNQLKSEMMKDTEIQLTELKSQLSKAEEDFTKSLEALSIDIQNKEARILELELQKVEVEANLSAEIKHRLNIRDAMERFFMEFVMDKMDKLYDACEKCGIEL